jgi:hypothetical protein
MPNRLTFAAVAVVAVLAGMGRARAEAASPDDGPGKPTSEQLAAIEKLQSVPPTSIEGRDVLEQEMMKGENEALAERLVELCLKDDRRELDFIVMVANRACRLDSKEGRNGVLRLGIDGPYLKMAALAAIDAFENSGHDPNHHRMFRSMYGVNLAIAYLRFHPEDNQSRSRLVKLAKQHAHLPAPVSLNSHKEHVSSKPSPVEPSQLSTPAAWEILLELDVLHPGMTPDEAIEILGPPSRRSETSLTWYIDTPRHVNPGLSAGVERGKIKEFRRYSG